MSIGTVRTIVTVQGRTTIAFTLAIFEIIIWVTVAGTVINQISDKPLLVIFYAFGYATGTSWGSWWSESWPLERRFPELSPPTQALPSPRL